MLCPPPPPHAAPHLTVHPRPACLQILADALLPLPRHPMNGVVSPALLATTGILPLSIFSTGPDIIGHYYDCIIAARREVVIMTNYWQGGQNVQKISDGLRELNRREAERQKKSQSRAERVRDPCKPHEPPRQRLVVKIMWDRGPRSVGDLLRMRTPVPVSEWKENGLPTPDEVECLHIEVLNYHRPIMGTFHAKLLLVDRRVALVNSNNIQDRPNLEAMARLEGDIVNSVYEHALLSWGVAMDPPLPCLEVPATADPGTMSFAPVARRKSVVATSKPPAKPEPGRVPAPTGTRSGTAASQDDLARLSNMTVLTLRERAQHARARLQQDADEAEEEELQGHRHFADVIDSVRRHRISSSADAPPSSIPHDDAKPRTSGPRSSGPRSEGESDDDTPWDAARKAGTQWRQKVLGDRFTRPPTTTGSTASEIPMQEVQAASTAPSTPADAAGTGSGSGSGSRTFADVVEALMQKEGIHPPGWADGALDALGLGESSSKNVALEARRARAARQAPLPQVQVPATVDEEDRLSRTMTGPSAATHVAPGEWPSTPRSKSTLASTAVGAEKSKDVDGGQALRPRESKQSVRSFSQAVPVTVMDDGLHPAPDEAPGTDALHHAALSVGPMPPAASAPAIDEAETEDGAPPGLQGYYRAHRLSNTSRQSAAERLNKITDRLDFANNSKVKGEITAERLHRMNHGSPYAASAPAVTNGASDSSSDPTTTQTTAATTANAGEMQDDEGHSSHESGGESDAGSLAGNDEIVYDPTDFSPFIFHRPHRPVPMALVNRRPHGTPGHSDIRNPQASAWLAGFRYAKEIFIQTPTLNAAPIKAAVLAAVQRGAKVELWLDLGFNDKSESMPFQGGTNEQVVTGMFRYLKSHAPESRKNLHVYWYTGKDMTRPLNAVRKQRNCHVKFAAFDQQVGILGSGNQDTQSWFHSQEINVMVDDQVVVKEWINALRRNQSTHIYGRVDDDGIWRGRTGTQKVDTGKDQKDDTGKEK